MASDLLEETLPHIENAIYRKRIPLLDWRMKVGAIPGAQKTDFREKGWTEIRMPFDWGGYDSTVWFRTRITVPDEFAGQTVGLRLRFPEAQVYVNGKPVQGIDGNRTEILLFEKVRRNQQIVLAVEAYAGRTRHKHTFDLAELVQIDPTARVLHTSLRSLRQLEQSLPNNAPELQRVREAIRRTLIFVKYFAPGGEEYPNAIGRAVGFLRQSIGTEFLSQRPGSIHLVGQSHIDLVWLWRFAETIRKAGRTFSTSVRLLERFPSLRFAQSQAALYDVIRTQHPSIWSEVQQFVSSDRWEPVGSTWVEPDCNMPSGESLVRQVQHGTSFFLRHFGKRSDVFWVPDSFGFAWSLPQILVRSGFRSFFTTKLRWNDTTAFPHTSFVWQGLDGSKILSHIPLVGLEGDVTAVSLQKTGRALDIDEASPPVMQTFGYGDGGGGITPEQVEALEVFRDAPAIPKAMLSSPSQFFRELSSHVDHLPVWNTELYLERHRGTFTTHGWLKKAHRDLENAMYVAELLGVLGEFSSIGRKSRYPEAELDALWKVLLFNQFHDILPGTFIRDAKEDILADLTQGLNRVAAIQRRSLGTLTSRASSTNRSTTSVLNPLAADRTGYVECRVPFSAPYFSVTNDRGDVLPYQKLASSSRESRLLVYLGAIPATSFVQIHIAPSDNAPEALPQWKISTKAVEGPAVRVRFDNKGAMSAIFDRKMRKDILQKAKRGNVFQTFRDEATQWQTWDVEKDFERKRVELFSLKATKMVEEGPLRVVIRQEYRSATGSVITQHIKLYHSTSRIDFDTTVRWKESQVMLKVAFPIAPRSTSAHFEIPFGAIERANRSKIPSDRAKFEVPALRWASMGDSKLGAALLNDGRYGYDAKDHLLRLTLIRSPHYPHPISPKDSVDPAVTDQGEQSFSYALYPHAGNWRSGAVTAEAAAFNAPLVVVDGAEVRPADPFLSVSKKNVFVSAIKKAEDGKGFIVRAYEGHGIATDATFTFGKKLSAAAECDLLEKNEKVLKTKKQRVQLRFRPFEIKTLRLLFVGKISIEPLPV